MKRTMFFRRKFRCDGSGTSKKRSQWLYYSSNWSVIDSQSRTIVQSIEILSRKTKMMKKKHQVGVEYSEAADFIHWNILVWRWRNKEKKYTYKYIQKANAPVCYNGVVFFSTIIIVIFVMSNDNSMILWAPVSLHACPGDSASLIYIQYVTCIYFWHYIHIHTPRQTLTYI